MQITSYNPTVVGTNDIRKYLNYMTVSQNIKKPLDILCTKKPHTKPYKKDTKNSPFTYEMMRSSVEARLKHLGAQIPQIILDLEEYRNTLIDHLKNTYNQHKLTPPTTYNLLNSKCTNASCADIPNPQDRELIQILIQTIHITQTYIQRLTNIQTKQAAQHNIPHYPKDGTQYRTHANNKSIQYIYLIQETEGILPTLKKYLPNNSTSDILDILNATTNNTTSTLEQQQDLIATIHNSAKLLQNKSYLIETVQQIQSKTPTPTDQSAHSTLPNEQNLHQSLQNLLTQYQTQPRPVQYHTVQKNNTTKSLSQDPVAPNPLHKLYLWMRNLTHTPDKQKTTTKNNQTATEQPQHHTHKLSETQITQYIAVLQQSAQDIRNSMDEIHQKIAQLEDEELCLQNRLQQCISHTNSIYKQTSALIKEICTHVQEWKNTLMHLQRQSSTTKTTPSNMEQHTTHFAPTTQHNSNLDIATTPLHPATTYLENNIKHTQNLLQKLYNTQIPKTQIPDINLITTPHQIKQQHKKQSIDIPNSEYIAKTINQLMQQQVRSIQGKICNKIDTHHTDQKIINETIRSVPDIISTIISPFTDEQIVAHQNNPSETKILKAIQSISTQICDLKSARQKLIRQHLEIQISYHKTHLYADELAQKHNLEMHQCTQEIALINQIVHTITHAQNQNQHTTPSHMLHTLFKCSTLLSHHYNSTQHHSANHTNAMEGINQTIQEAITQVEQLSTLHYANKLLTQNTQDQNTDIQTAQNHMESCTQKLQNTLELLQKTKNNLQNQLQQYTPDRIISTKQRTSIIENLEKQTQTHTTPNYQHTDLQSANQQINDIKNSINNISQQINHINDEILNLQNQAKQHQQNIALMAKQHKHNLQRRIITAIVNQYHLPVSAIDTQSTTNNLSQTTKTNTTDNPQLNMQFRNIAEVLNYFTELQEPAKQLTKPINRLNISNINTTTDHIMFILPSSPDTTNLHETQRTNTLMPIPTPSKPPSLPAKNHNNIKSCHQTTQALLNTYAQPTVDIKNIITELYNIKLNTITQQTQLRSLEHNLTKHHLAICKLHSMQKTNPSTQNSKESKPEHNTSAHNAQQNNKTHTPTETQQTSVQQPEKQNNTSELKNANAQEIINQIISPEKPQLFIGKFAGTKGKPKLIKLIDSLVQSHQECPSCNFNLCIEQYSTSPPDPLSNQKQATKSTKQDNQILKKQISNAHSQPLIPLNTTPNKTRNT